MKQSGKIYTRSVNTKRNIKLKQMGWKQQISRY